MLAPISARRPFIKTLRIVTVDILVFYVQFKMSRIGVPTIKRLRNLTVDILVFYVPFKMSRMIGVSTLKVAHSPTVQSPSLRCKRVGGCAREFGMKEVRMKDQRGSDLGAYRSVCDCPRGSSNCTKPTGKVLT